MNKTFKVAQVRDLLNQVNNEQITFSRFVEILNEAQKEAYNQAIDQILKLMYDHEEEIYIGIFEDIEKLKK